jgi:hypothetical protein
MRNCLAFPRPEVWSNELHRADAVDGMLLRDYFAGIVLGGICGMEKAKPSDMPIYVKRCYMELVVSILFLLFSCAIFLLIRGK